MQRDRMVVEKALKKKGFIQDDTHHHLFWYVTIDRGLPLQNRIHYWKSPKLFSLLDNINWLLSTEKPHRMNSFQ